MKMVSQLTRQAMSRHRLLSSGSSVPSFPPAQPAPRPTGFQTVHPLYSASAPAAQPTVPPAPPAYTSAPAHSPVPSQPPIPRQRTIYQQLMSSHDRVTERHLKHT